MRIEDFGDAVGKIWDEKEADEGSLDSVGERDEVESKRRWKNKRQERR